ncbi:major facilitator superfamily MFS_1 [Shewanella halifaxensis HAW-EB4]|uniref:Major facilitator superfamily MFS_1 n=1 Tax=Shewanella halifaxensis (strain HAW-EB4) TaxID=458817 RepID=B0TMW1_SHEHH|nr:MFS transporter [Shewanella halifaxensis]ABZ78699.1 major facilitator superfamily MFS_1 [Shewanella halifaxensis HAW-EB4]
MLFSRRFLPYFVTQCLGALNDNVFKNVLLLLVSYSQIDELPIDVHLFVNLAAGLFILPFLLFSAHAGQVADSVDKALLIRRLKVLELVIMTVAIFAIISHSYLLMLLLLFLTGVQSAYFGPVKYSLLPRVLRDSELVSGNAWVEMGTFLAILAGTISAGMIVASDYATYWAAATVFTLALIGMTASWFIPSIPAHSDVKPRFSIVSATLVNIKKVRQSSEIWTAILAISWFWFVGATYLTQFPNFARITLNADPTVVSLLLLLFSVGIGTGSFVCERLSCRQVELGIMPLGLTLLAIFGIDLYFALPGQLGVETLYSLQSFIAEAAHYHLMLDLFMIGVGGGLFIVPLYTYIQARAKEGECAQAIASNNIINALFMVSSAIFAMLALNVLQWSIAQLFLLLASANLLVLLLLLWRWPELLLSVCSYFIRRVKYKTQLLDPELLHKSPKLLLVTNGLTWRDLVVIFGSFSHPVLFTSDVYQKAANHGLVSWALSRLTWYAGRHIDIDSVICVNNPSVGEFKARAEFADYKVVRVTFDAVEGRELRVKITPLAADNDRLMGLA